MLYLNDEKKFDTKEEYILETNEKKQKIIKTIDKEKEQEINIIFENEEESNVRCFKTINQILY